MDNSEFLLVSRAAFSKRAKEDGEFLHWATDLRDELPIVMKRSGPGSEPPQTFAQNLLQNIRACPAKDALRVKRGNKWISWTWQQYFDDASRFAKALIAVGLTERACTNIIGCNCPEWVICFTGAVLANCVPVGIYITSGTEACFYVADHSEAQAVIVQNETHLMKYLSIWPKLPALKAVICWSPGAEFNTLRKGHSHIYTWDEFMALGANVDQTVLDGRIETQTPGQPCTIVYTSGTTGPPKGAIISNDNYTWVSKSVASLFDVGDDEHIVSYLPLSHSAAQVVDIFVATLIKACVSFADEKALQGTLGETLREVRPTIFLAVPRVYEKVEEAIRGQAAKAGSFKKKIATWAKDVGLRSTLSQLKGQNVPWGYCLANYLVFHKVKEALGLDRAKVCVVSSAPVARSTLEFFFSLNLPVFNVYGMTETAAPTTFNTHLRNDVYSVGFAIPGSDLKILSTRGEPQRPGERGEICVRGRHRFLGYYKNPKETKEMIDSNGYVHSGDEGYLDANGFLFITGRFKELIITAGGENIPPVIIEDMVKDECKLISNVLLVGDGRKFLAALITLKNITSSDGSPSNKLPQDSLTILHKLGSEAQTVTEAVLCPKVRALVDKVIAIVNAKSTSRAQHIRKWRFLPRDFSVADGDLTPTMKMKRKVVAEKYRVEIEALYSDPKL